MTILTLSAAIPVVMATPLEPNIEQLVIIYELHLC